MIYIIIFETFLILIYVFRDYLIKKYWLASIEYIEVICDIDTISEKQRLDQIKTHFKALRLKISTNWS